MKVGLAGDGGTDRTIFKNLCSKLILANDISFTLFY